MLELSDQVAILPGGTGLECLILVDGQFAAYYRFRDTPREDSESFIQHLFRKHGVKKTMIVSGDRKEEVKYLANFVGDPRGLCKQTPEIKVKIVVKETQKAKTVFQAMVSMMRLPLLTATVGIAFGQNSDITAEAAGAVSSWRALLKE